MTEQNTAYLVRGEPYRMINFVMDGLLAAGSGFNSNSLYNTGRLVVPGRFVMGEFELDSKQGQLFLRTERFFVDRTPETLCKYEQQIRDRKIEVRGTYQLGNTDLQHIVAQAARHMLEPKSGDLRERPRTLELFLGTNRA